MTRKQNLAGRPRTFDYNETLDHVIPVFFEHGFSGASFPQLEEATGLHRQSLRYAYGDKTGLFRAAVKRYGENKVGEITAILAKADRAIEGVHGVFEMWCNDLGRERCRGCLLVSTTSDRAVANEPSVLAAISSINKKIIGLLERQFYRARAEGDVTSELSDRALAQHMLTVGDGMMALCQLPESRASARPVFDGFCAQLNS